MLNTRNKLLVLLYVALLAMITGCSVFRKTPVKSPSTTTNSTTTNSTANFPITKQQHEKLYNACQQWLGVPYKFGGTTKGGVDCSALVNALYKQAYGMQLPRTTAEMSAKYPPVKLNDLRMGDLVYFNFESKKASHVGLYLNNKQFIHASTKKGVIVGSLTDAYNSKYYIGAGRVLPTAK